MNKVKKSTDTNEVKDTHKPVNKKAWKIIGYCLLALPVVWIVLTVVVPLAMGDGLDRYSGAKKTIAEAAVLNKTVQIDNLNRWAYAIHVDDVRPTTDDEVSKYCIQRQHNQKIVTSNDPNDPHFYTVTLTVRNIGTLSSEKLFYDGCQLLTTRFGDGSR